MGEDQLPPNRPDTTMVFIPETQQMKQDGLELNRAIVVDARLRPSHSPESVQAVLMQTCKSEFPFQLTHMSGTQYLLLLPPGADRHRFLLGVSQPLQNLGYVTYPWTPAINGYPLKLKFKVWIKLMNLSPLAWTIDHLVPAVSSFGIVLDHCSLTRVNSIESLRAVIAVPDLGKIPHSLMMWIRGVGRPVEVRVHSWLEEPLPLIPPIDTTPSQQFFEKVRSENAKAMSGFADDKGREGNLSVDFDTMVLVWESMEAGPKKDKIEQVLRTSPLFHAREHSKGPLVTTETSGAGDDGETCTVVGNNTQATARLPVDKGKGIQMEASSTPFTGQTTPRNRGQLIINANPEFTPQETPCQRVHPAVNSGQIISQNSGSGKGLDRGGKVENEAQGTMGQDLHLPKPGPVNQKPRPTNNTTLGTGPNSDTEDTAGQHSSPTQQANKAQSHHLNSPTQQPNTAAQHTPKKQSTGPKPPPPPPQPTSTNLPTCPTQPPDTPNSLLEKEDPINQLQNEDPLSQHPRENTQSDSFTSPILSPAPSMDEPYDSNYEDFGHDTPDGRVSSPDPYAIDLPMWEAEVAGIEQQQEDLALDEVQEGQDDDAHIPPPLEPETRRSLRRSARISKKTPKSYASKKTRGKRGKKRGSASARRGKKGRIQEEDLLKALDLEALQAEPLDEETINQVNRYCGLLQASQSADRDQPGTSHAREEPSQQGSTYDGNESVLDSFDDSEGLTEDDESGEDLGSDK